MDSLVAGLRGVDSLVAGLRGVDSLVAGSGEWTLWWRG